MAGQNYRDLVVWQRSMDLVEEVYRAIGTFPRDERFGLTIQMRRAAVSVPCNIAEGQGRTAPRDFARFLNMAHGSVRELETQVLLAERLTFLEPDRAADLLTRMAEIGRLLNGLINSLHQRYPEEWQS
jgi:four helix bundle protein